MVLANSIPYSARSTADQVLAGIDLSRKCILITGCNGGIRFETMSALAADGARVSGLARSLASAKNACDKAGPSATPVPRGLEDIDSGAAPAEPILALHF